MLTRQQIGQMIRAGDHDLLVRRILANGRSSDSSVLELLTRSEAVEMAGLGLALQRASELAAAGLGVAMPIRERRSIRAGQAPPPPLAAVFDQAARRLMNLAGEMIDHADQGDPASPPIGRPHEMASSESLAGATEEVPAGSLFAPVVTVPSCVLAAAACAARGLLDHAAAAEARPLAFVGVTSENRSASPSEIGSRGPVRCREVAAAIIRFLTRLQGADGHIGSPIASAVILWQLGGQEAFRERIRLDDLCLAVRRSTTRRHTAVAIRVAEAASARTRPNWRSTDEDHANEAGAPRSRMPGRDAHTPRDDRTGGHAPLPIGSGLQRQALAWSA